MKTKLIFSRFVRRIIVAKTLGFLFGLIAFLFLPCIIPDDCRLCWGVFLWYTTFGGIIGLMGIINQHPLWPKFRINAFFRGIFIGAWLNFVLVFFAYEKLELVLSRVDFMGMTSPWWFVLEGAILGLIIDLLATKYGGEGKKIL
jgi:hypothetical protein